MLVGQSGFDDGLHGADVNASGGIVMPLALNAGLLVDHVQDAVAFTDGFGGAFRHARAARDAIFCDLHGHG